MAATTPRGARISSRRSTDPCCSPTNKADGAIRTVLIIYTGGTIGMKPSSRGYVPAKGYLPAVMASLPMFNDKSFKQPPGKLGLTTPVSSFGHRFYYEIVEFEPLLDSSNMNCRDWSRIAETVKDNYAEWDAFVVLHGTDTMSYTASALSFMFKNLSKTVVLTGSQIPLSRPRNDGLNNLLGAMTLAGHYDIPEVCLYFHHKLMRGNRTSKVDASGLEAFDSPNMDVLATTGIDIVVNWNLVRLSPSKGEFCIETGFCEDIAIQSIFPGKFTSMKTFLAPIDESTALVKGSRSLRGLVLQTFGAGNAPDNDKDLMSALKEATSRDDHPVVIVNISQCGKGKVESAYATGVALVDAGVVGGSDMTVEAAIVKLGWLLAHSDNLSVTEIRRLMSTNLRGELTEEVNDVVFSLQDSTFIRQLYHAMEATRREMGIQSSDSGEDNIQKVIQIILPTLACGAAEQGDVELLESIMTSPGAANVADYDKRTPLHLAASSGEKDVIEFLLKSNADCNAKDRFGRTPLQDAIEHEIHEEAIKILLDHGAKLLMDNAKLCFVLNDLARLGDAKKLRLWLFCGADPNVSDYDNRSPLHIAACEGHHEIVSLLIEFGAVKCQKDRWGCTPYDGSVGEEVARLLSE